MVLLMFLLAQAPFLRSDPVRINLLPVLRADPPALVRRFEPDFRVRGSRFFTRILVDEAHHTYFGYELLVEAKQPGLYLATFGKLNISPMDIASERLPVEVEKWSNVSIPSIPEPRLVRDGEVFTIDLFAESGQKLVDDLRINPLLGRRAPMIPVVRAVPTVSGEARDFSPADAELQLVQPRAVIFNDRAQGAPSLRNVRGPLVWVYVPEHGRYIMSLSPRAGLDFVKAGEVRGGMISFKVGQDSIKVECSTPIAAGDAAYSLWVLHDADWSPISESQKDRPSVGSVGAAELKALKQQ